MKLDSRFSNILVCVDNSKQSQKALSRAISIAEKFDSKLNILMVIEDRQVDFWNDTEYKVGADNPQIHLKKESKIFQQVEKILNDLVKRVPSKINCVTEILTGDPAKVIVNYSKKKKPDVIIMGARGLGGFSKLLLGSVSSKVSDHASSSVLVVR
jgi:nucleotide-binding universal stress UspA family protein